VVLHARQLQHTGVFFSPHAHTFPQPNFSSLVNTPHEIPQQSFFARPSR
jgi:hypothetical protein